MQTRKLTIEDLRQPNFEPKEFLESNTAKKLGLKNEPNYTQLTAGVHLSRKIQEMRNAICKFLGKELIINITSGFRTYEVNKAVGGDPNSKHLQFLACDFNIRGYSPEEGVHIIKESGFKADKCFIERGCIHIQFNLDDAKNRNIFAEAEKIDGVWRITKFV